VRTLLPQLRRWISRGERFALATVVRVEGSAPRAPGESLIISADGLHFAGAVSSGCLENEVLECAGEVLRSGRMQRLHFGPDGVFPWREGLSCGGRIEVSVEPWWGCLLDEDQQGIAELVMACLEDDLGCFVLSRGGDHYAEDSEGLGTGRRQRFEAGLLERARGLLQAGCESSISGEGDESVVIRLIHPRRRLALAGAVDLAVRIVPLARAAGYRTVVLDPRRAYASDERFSEAPDELLCGWPGELIPGLGLGTRDAALVLSHDPKIDDPALIAFLRCGVAYIGALGSVNSHSKRLSRLREQGVEETELARIEGPAGLKLGVDAASVAMGIMAGVVRGVRRAPFPG